LGKKSWQRILAFSLIGIGLITYIYSIDFVVSKLPPHQQNRIMVLFNPDIDPLGVGWNVTQSKIAIGSGGFFGKGYLEGTQTKFDFVPEQDTDFIFCTLGEEFGWMGSFVVISLFAGLLYRLVIMAERQKTRFSRIYGYGVVSILLFHFMVNIAMTIGLFPVVGIPLPFFSYGGSSLWSFTVLLFIFIKLDSSRASQLGRIS
jgi:rod shape determining protein RodA